MAKIHIAKQEPAEAVSLWPERSSVLSGQSCHPRVGTRVAGSTATTCSIVVVLQLLHWSCGRQAVRLAYEAHALCKRARDKAAEACACRQKPQAIEM